ncbi:MAG: M16 family metallopeptidase [Candidatus Sumerlaeaceae bacterium]|jgi:predicted Zn-dependent peptidase
MKQIFTDLFPSLTRKRSFFSTLLTVCAVLMTAFAVNARGSEGTSAPLGLRERIDKLFPPPLDATTSASVERGGLRLPVRPEQLPEQPFKFVVPRVEQRLLSNGTKIFSYSAPQALGFYAVAIIEAGSVCDPPEKLGLAEVTALAMRSGGAGSYSSDELDRQLDRLGASLAVDVQRDYVRFTLFCLPEKAPESLQLLRFILIAPRFELAAVQREKALFKERLVRVEDDPAELSRREFRKVVYGTTHPLARTPRISDVDRLSREDVRAFYKKYYGPWSTRIGIAALDPKSSTGDKIQLFEQWHVPGQKPTVNRGTVPADLSPAFQGLYVLPKEIEQVYIRMGHIGRPRDPNDQPVVDVLNNVFGTGGLTSRLMQKVRTEYGLAYAVGGGVFEDNPAGVFAAVGSTKAQSAADALSIMRQVIEELAKVPPTKEELETAKRDAMFAFSSRFASPQETLVQYMLADLYGYPPDYLSNYMARVEQVTAHDVHAAAQRYVRSEKLAVLVLGRETVTESLSKKFGKVTPWQQPKSSESAKQRKR